MQNTTNYNLNKPDGTDYAKIQALNQNADIIDTELKKSEDHFNKKDNPHEVTKAQVGLGSVQNFTVATQAEAEEGTSESKYMTPQRTKQAIDKVLTLLNNKITQHLDESKAFTEYTLSTNQSVAANNNTRLTFGVKTTKNGDKSTDLVGGRIKVLEKGVYQISSTTAFSSKSQNSYVRTVVGLSTVAQNSVGVSYGNYLSNNNLMTLNEGEFIDAYLYHEMTQATDVLAAESIVKVRKVANL